MTLGAVVRSKQCYGTQLAFDETRVLGLHKGLLHSADWARFSLKNTARARRALAGLLNGAPPIGLTLLCVPKEVSGEE
jgi:hypothetical protein